MKSFQQLVDIVKRLRGPEGCPWDRAQTHESLTPYAIEEAHELEEAIANRDQENIKEELGDLLFQSVLHAELARQAGQFDIEDVLETLNNKMVYRHPHVFSDTKVNDSGEVKKNWEELKASEKSDNPGKDPFDIPKSFPALLRSHKIGKRAKTMDFDWDTPEQVWSEVTGEVAELKEALATGQRDAIEDELGDVLFTLSQLARHLDLDAEKALRRSNRKFLIRFRKMLEVEPQFEKISRDDKEKLWSRVKKILKDDGL